MKSQRFNLRIFSFQKIQLQNEMIAEPQVSEGKSIETPMLLKPQSY